MSYTPGVRRYGGGDVKRLGLLIAGVVLAAGPVAPAAGQSVPPGEAFIRCYLQGYLRAKSTFPNTDLLTCAWLPDTFGFCSSLPILYLAMGFGVRSCGNR